jgi:RES domain-containing protein
LQLFRITTAKWAGVLTGSGYPARWNSKGYHVIYTASTRALACLENLVHRSGEGLNNHFRITTIEVPDFASMESVNENELPPGWYKAGRASTCRVIGDRWLDKGTSLLLKVPSAIIREEFNLLINPKHPEFRSIQVTGITDFEFDERL